MGFQRILIKIWKSLAYVVEGTLSHQDSMGNMKELTRGQVQYMSAGKGVTHSEYNLKDDPLRILQIWILPDKEGYEPNYGDYNFNWDERVGKWLEIVSSTKGDAPIKIHQDINVFVTELEEGESISYKLEEGCQAYLVQIEGQGSINGVLIDEKDGVEIQGESMIALKAITQSHYILFDMREN